MRMLIILAVALVSITASTAYARILEGTRPDGSVSPRQQVQSTCAMGYFLINNAISATEFGQKLDDLKNPKAFVTPVECQTAEPQLHFWVVPIRSDGGEQIFVVNSELEKAQEIIQQKLGSK